MKGRLTGLNGFAGLLFLVVLLTLFAYNYEYIETGKTTTVDAIERCLTVICQELFTENMVFS